MHPIRDRRVVLDMTGFDRGDAPLLFDHERRLRCEIARERDVDAPRPGSPSRPPLPRARLGRLAPAIGVRTAVAHYGLKAGTPPLTL
jgi:hypothetical protein